MVTPTRRAILVGTVALVIGGCTGNELDPGEDPPADLVAGGDDDELTAANLETIVEFAQRSMETLDNAAGALETWLDAPEAADISAIDDVRRDATRRFNEYARTVAPHHEALADLDPGATVGDTTWEGDGPALASALVEHERLLVSSEDAAIRIVDAEGDPRRVGSAGYDAAEAVVERTEAVLEATREALPAGAGDAVD